MKRRSWGFVLTLGASEGAANEARRQGALADEIEIRRRWKPQGRRVAFRHIDVKQLHTDAKVAGMLCKGGPIKCKLKGWSGKPHR